jgi:excinuclease ABC subunit C
MRESHPDATRLEFKVPSRGSRADLVAMAQKNAAWRLEETTRLARSGQVELEAIQDRLGLSRTPRRVECIDISNLQGTAIVASDVCFVDGKPAKDLYRHYKIEGVTGSADDFGSIKEVVRRRFARAVRDQDAPDLLVIDGGRGQLSSALEAAREFPELSIDLVGLAKSKLLKDRGRRRHTGVPTETIGENRERSYERVFFPEKELPLALAPGTPEYRLLTRIRDEAHRFAITHHRKSRSRVLQGSALTEVPGIGETLRKKLLATFGGLEGIRKASLAELKAVPGIKESAAVALHGYLRGEEDGEAASEGEVPVTSPS